MHRVRGAVLAASMAALQPATFTVSTLPLADVHQESLQATSPQSKQTTEVFPGTYPSAFAEAIMKRISNLIGRVDEVDRATLVAAKVGVGVDRSIIAWRANPSGDAVVLAVRYHRDRLLQLDMQFSNDYGGPEPLDPADFESLTLARCSRAGAGGWTCGEEVLAAVATAHNVTLPARPAERRPAIETLLDRVLTAK